MKTLNLGLHKAQMEVFKNPARVKVVCAGRRTGKTYCLISTVIERALTFKGVIDPAAPPICLIAAPTLKMAKRLHWKPLLNLLRDNPLVESINKTDFIIKFKGKRPDIVLSGVDDGGERLRGSKIYFAGLDEFQDFKPDTWDEVIYPALSDTPNSTALVIFTPKGLTNHTYKFHLKAKITSGWKYFHFTTADNPFFPPKRLEEAKNTLPPRVFQQEYCADFVSFLGQIFDCLEEKHLIEDKELPTSYEAIYSAIDWGDVNPAISIIGISNQKAYVIDYWENETKQPIVSDVVNNQLLRLAQKYNIHRCYCGHDRPGSIIQLRSLPHKGLQNAVQAYNKVIESYTWTNSLFFQDRLYIRKSLKRVIDTFRSYHRENKNGVLIDYPAPNQDDHIVDATKSIIASLVHKKVLKNVSMEYE